MSVPNYGELGKAAREVFRSGYAYDVAKVKVNAKPGIEGSAALDLKTYEPSGSILGRFSDSGIGQFSLKLSTPALLVAEYSKNGVITEEVDFEAGYSINLSDKFQSVRVAGKFHNGLTHITGSLTKDLDGDTRLHGTAVLKFGSLLVGYQAEIKPDGSSLTKNDLTVGYEHESSAGLYFRCLRIPKELGFSAFYRASDLVDVGLDAKMGMSEESKPWFCGAGLSYKLDDGSKLRMKFDKNLQLGTSLQFPIHEGFKLTLGMNFDLMKPASGKHKVGMGLDVEL